MIVDREQLAKQIQEWNANRLDLFALTVPDPVSLEFFGVMRFFYQDASEGAKVSTKCVRVSSTATVNAVLETLIEKFRPDMRMLSMNKYCLYEVHADGDERRMDDEDHPLEVQLTWGKDDREGRFLLKREDVKTAFMEDFHDKGVTPQPFKRKLSKREKKDQKKKNKEARAKGKENAAEQLYNELPDTSFTRTVSNPEAVMKRRRQQKLEKKMAQFKSQDGGPDSGGTLKIYGETLCPDVPYKTLLLSTSDTALMVLKETLAKYRLEKEDSNDYCLFKVNLVPSKDGSGKLEYGDEEILDDDECPLAIHIQYPPSQGSVMFQIRRRPADYEKRKRARKQQQQMHPNDMDYGQGRPPHSGMHPGSIPPEKLPFLVELHPDGREPYNANKHRLQFDMLEVGSDRNMSSSGQYLQLFGPHVHPRHCVIAQSEGIVTVTPTNKDAETYVNNQRVFETTTLQHGMVVRFGKANLFRFLDPMAEEKQNKRQSEPGMRQQGPYNGHQQPGAFETSFDVDGHVETNQGMRRPDEQQRGTPPDGMRGGPVNKVEEDLLPAGLEFREDAEDQFLGSLITDSSVPTVVFKLAPTYALYMSARYRVSRHYRPDMSASERAHRLTSLVHKIAGMTQQTIQEEHDNANALAFWMANTSELLHFFKQDRNIGPYSIDAQDILAEAVQVAFRELVLCLQNDLRQTMPAFLDDGDEDADEDWMMDDQVDVHNRYQRNRPMMTDVIQTMSAAMALLRRCRVNAALTIQLFSQLFHYINMWLFNKIVMEARLRLCTRRWGFRLKRRLARIEVWAEKQGLELAADCHLARIIQTAHLLQSQKHSAEDIASISSSCFKLNSLQLRVLLQSYIPDHEEGHVPQDLINRLVSMAENTADELIRSEGREVHLEEDPDLHLPFLLPEDGYSCDIVRGIPNGLPEFLDPLINSGICNLVIHHQAPGPWTVYMDNELPENMVRHSPGGPQSEPAAPPGLPQEPEVMMVSFGKVNGSMGLSIVAAKGEGQKERGIYIKSVVTGGAAALDGRLQAGDQLLDVDGKSLIGLTQEKAAELMTRTGAVVNLRVAKQGAIYHGLATLLSQPSPIMQRAGSKQQVAPPADKSRPKSQDVSRFGPVMDDGYVPPPNRYPAYQNRSLQEQHGPQSKSTPSLPNEVPNDQHNTTYDRRQQANAPYQQGARDPSRSKSTSNLKQEPDHEEARRRQLMSTGSFPRDVQQGRSHPNLAGPDERNAGYPADSRPNYENYGPNRGEASGQPGRQFGSSPQLLENSVPDQFRKPEPPRMEERSAPRHHSHSDRPVSAHFPQGRPDLISSRPKSEDIDAMKMRDLRQKYDLDDPHSSFRSDHNSSYQDSPNSSFRAEPPHGTPKPEVNVRIEDPMKSQLTMQGFTVVPDSRNDRMSLSSKEGSEDIPKFAKQSSQPHFFQNTRMRERDPTPPFEQLKRQEVMNRPPLAPKPKVAPKPFDGPRAPPQQEIPSMAVDHRKSQPNFFYGESEPVQQPYGGFNQPMGKSTVKVSFSGRPDSPELPPPPPPDVSGMDDPDAEDMPPPPPPPQDYTPYAQQAYGNRNRMEQPNRGPRPNEQNRTSFHQDQQPRWGQKPSPPHVSPTVAATSQAMMQFPNQPHTDSHSQPSMRQNDATFPRQQQPPRQDEGPKWQQPKPKVQLNVPGGHERPESPSSSPSPWDREQREKEKKLQEEEAAHYRDREIADLEMKPYLAPEEQERLRRLKLDQEFARRLKEVKDDDDQDDEDDLAERTASHNRLAKKIFEDLERTQALRKQKDAIEKEEEKLKALDMKQREESMLQRFDKERDEQRQRQARKQERQDREHEAWLQKQRDQREKQRQEQEEHKRMIQQEEERLKQKREEEVRRKKEQEKEQLREMQAAREAEERAIKEENARRQQEEFLRQRQQPDQRYYDDNRNERFGKPSPYGQQPPQNSRINSYGNDNRGEGPPPPQRGSSFNMVNQVRGRGSDSSQEQIPPYRVNANIRPPLDAAAQKKTVSFDAKLTTEIAPGYKDGPQTPPANDLSYRTGNQSAYNPASYQPEHNNPTLQQNQQNMINYQVQTTPGVIGSQEVYRDPRDRRLQQQQQGNQAPGEKLSFRDKMKLFAETAGENTPKEKPRSSRSQRILEMNLATP
ncbi:afadin-like isoform X2 [Lineus longissimus]|uniref:afadin-like isoform X2 n=1 Tax=Lineus longissimus TaxID=88925 RepID=UPI00315CBBC7